MEKAKLKNALVIPDCHIPFHDKRAFNLMLDVASDVDIHEIVILGDFLDFYSVSSHGKAPGITTHLMEEVECAHDELAKIRKMFPKANLVYIVGNHEHRLARYVENFCPALFGMIGLEGILRPSLFNMTLIPYGRYQKYQVLGSRLWARHEPFSGGEHCAAGTVKKACASVIFGHTHRIQEFQTVGLDGKNHRGISSGWLGEAKHEVFNYLKNHEQWAQGFAIVNVEPNRNFHCNLIHIIDYKCSANGHVYEG